MTDDLSELREDPTNAQWNKFGFGTIAPEFFTEICEDPTYARFTVCEYLV